MSSISRALSVVAAAEVAGDRVGVVLPDGQEMTWGELAERALLRPESRPLRETGRDLPLDVEPRILIADRTLETLDAFHASWFVGRPLLLVDPQDSPSELRRWERIVRSQNRVLSPGGDVAAAPPDDRALWIVPTSGSTGRPKGIVQTRRAVCVAADASAANLSWLSDDRWLLCLPTSHVGGASILVRCLMARRTTVLAPPGVFGAADVLERIRRHRVTLMSLVPTQLHRLLQQPGRAPESLRAVLLGGAAASDDLVGKARDRGWPILTTWGMTETGGQVTTQRPGERLGEGSDSGRPLPGLEIRITARGRIAVHGSSLAEGTYDESGFVRRKGRWLETADLGRLDEQGRLHVLGRADVVILSGGEKIQPEEIEEVLLAHPEVRAACVVGLEDPEWGERVVAAVEAPGAAAEALGSWCRGRLTGGRVPKGIRILDEIPTTRTGKIDRRAVELLLASWLSERR